MNLLAWMIRKLPKIHQKEMNPPAKMNRSFSSFKKKSSRLNACLCLTRFSPLLTCSVIFWSKSTRNQARKQSTSSEISINTLETTSETSSSREKCQNPATTVSKRIEQEEQKPGSTVPVTRPTLMCSQRLTSSATFSCFLGIRNSCILLRYQACSICCIICWIYQQFYSISHCILLS